MARIIYKYPFPIQASFSLDLPLGAKILHVAMQGDQPCIWAEFNKQEVMVNQRDFQVVGTGFDIPYNLTYLATLQTPPFVWHLYEEVHG